MKSHWLREGGYVREFARRARWPFAMRSAKAASEMAVCHANTPKICCRSAIFIKYTVGCFLAESVQSLNRDDVAICREISGRDWIVTADYQKGLSVRAICLLYE